MRTVRWRQVNLSICLLWVVLAGWSVWEHFDPPPPVKLGLLATSLWLLVVGIVMQALPGAEAASRRGAGGTGTVRGARAEGSAQSMRKVQLSGTLPTHRLARGAPSGRAQPSAASQRAQTPGWAWVPTSGRIFQQRAHFSPSAQRRDHRDAGDVVEGEGVRRGRGVGRASGRR